MQTYETLKHTTWDCKYHVVFIPKYRRKTLYAQLRRDFFWFGIPGFGRAKGMHSGRGASDARSRPPDVAGAAAVCGIKRDGVHQRQECDPHRTGVCGPTTEFCQPTFFGTGYRVSMAGKNEAAVRRYIQD